MTGLATEQITVDGEKVIAYLNEHKHKTYPFSVVLVGERKVRLPCQADRVGVTLDIALDIYRGETMPNNTNSEQAMKQFMESI